MNKVFDADSIIFDLDGTLWDSTDVVLKAWNDILREEKGVRGEITRAELQSVMGFQIPQITEKLFPGLEPDYCTSLIERICSYECGLLREEGGVLYQGVESVLKKLSEKYPLFIVSNCQCGYIEAFFSYHGLEKYIKDYEHPGNTGLSKGENIKIIMERNGLKRPVYIGDTQGDRDSAGFAGIPFIYAGYGFGRVEQYDYLIKEIADLENILL